MPPRRSRHCPRCGFSFAWNGRKCGHCPPPSRARQLWEQVDHFPELVGSTKTISAGQLRAIAAGCVDRVAGLLPPEFRELVERLDTDAPDQAEPARPAERATDEDWLTHHIRATLRSPTAATVQALADRCRRLVARSFPHRDLFSFPLPPEFEPHRPRIVAAFAGVGGAVGEDDPARVALEYLRDQESEYSRQRWAADRAEAFGQCEVARDVLGYPEVSVAFDPAWRTSTVLALARGIAESRDFGVMPILADALQDAGCEEPEILEHCRAEKPHTRGCWVVEALAGGVLG